LRPVGPLAYRVAARVEGGYGSVGTPEETYESAVRRSGVDNSTLAGGLWSYHRADRGERHGAPRSFRSRRRRLWLPSVTRKLSSLSATATQRAVDRAKVRLQRGRSVPSEQAMAGAQSGALTCLRL